MQKDPKDEELKEEEETRGSRKKRPNSLLEVQVNNPNGRRIFRNMNLAVYPEKTSFTPRKREGGLHEICFSYHQSVASGFEMRVFLDIENIDDLDDKELIDRNLQPMESAFQTLQHKLERVNSEFEYMRSREHRMAITSGTTNDRIQWFSFLSISILIGVSCYQILHLKSFFLSKKLL